MGDFGSFLHSSLSCAGTEVVYSKLQSFLADIGGHAFIAMALTLLIVLRSWSRFWLLGAWSLAVAKELAFDMPNGGWADVVIADSLVDIITYPLAAAFVFVLLAPVSEVRT